MNQELEPNDVNGAPFIEGGVLESESERVIDIVNPSNGRSIFTIPTGCEADVDHAVFAARRCFEDARWRDLPVSFKKKTLHRFADLIEAEALKLDALDAGEMGKPIRESFANSAAASGLMRFYAEAIDKMDGDVYTSDQGSFVAQALIPRGVVAAVVPWNFPVFNAILKIAPAIAAGNSVVLKPSELSSRSALRLAHLAIRAGVPPGVLNVVPGLGDTVGRALGLHPHVDMMTFTGSSRIGKMMLQYAGQSNMKVVMAECGGKSPQIIFDDGVDWESAARSIANHLLINQGQICNVGSRLLVQRSIEAAMVKKLIARFTEIVMGDALDPQTSFGPIVSEKQCSRVMQYIESGEADGAERVIGGRRVRIETGGYFIEPTLFRNVSPDSKIAREEIFGPVLSVIPFDSEADAIRIANDTMYGLAAYVWTANLSTGMRMAKAIRSSVKVNGSAPQGDGAGYASSNEPFGESGIGIEGGIAGMRCYFRRQRIWINYA